MQWKIVFPLLAAVFVVGLSQLPGGFTDADINDKDFQNALNFAVVQHNKGTNDIYLRKVVQVVRAQQQVVAGIKYVITVKIVKTTCRKDQPNGQCVPPPGAQPYQCTFTVVSIPWLNQIQLLEEKC